MAETTAKYINGLGRRKEASAQVRLTPEGTGIITVNGREMAEYFPLFTLQQAVNAPFVATGLEKRFDVSVKVAGGGIHGQADAIKLGIARALIEINPELRTALKALGYLSRDARVRERKKYGHTGARRSPQWAKR
ncbi:30S ribosomal protein S9 [bacterium]|nr:30S ribosomal protein S9 [bacterium]